MTYREAVKEFKMTYKNLYKNAVDYWTAQQKWAFYTDRLCKEGIITEKQFMNWATPFPYGKHLKPIK